MRILIYFIITLAYSQSALAVGRGSVLSENQTPLFKNSRPCCSLTQDPFSRLMGFTKTSHVSTLESHIYKNNDTDKEGNGLVYTCNNGYIDLTHLRDTADWTKEIYVNLESKLGKGKYLKVKNEGARRSLYLKKIDISDLTREDLVIIAANISYENSVWHEVATGFSFVKFQHMSAFSPEDNFSNYLGTHLAKDAILNGGDFNTSMTDNIYDFLIQNKNRVSSERVSKDLANLKGIVWEYSGLMTDLLIRNTKTYGHITSYKSPHHLNLGCSKKSLEVDGSLEVINKLSNGRLASDYFNLKVQISNSMRKVFMQAGKRVQKKTLTEEDHKWLIPLMLRYRTIVK